MISLFVSCSCATVVLCLSQQAMHWFLIPVVACGTVVGIDAVDWFRGRFHPFDPAGVLGLLGYHVFFLSTMLVGGWEHRLRYLPDQPEDYRPWLGALAALTLVGLLVYRWALGACVRGTDREAAASSLWMIAPKQFWILLLVGLLVSGSLQVWAYIQLGGIQGYISEYSAWLKGQDAFHGTTALFAISESFPILAMFGYAMWSKGAKWRRSWVMLGVVLVAYFVLLLLFGGLRGSRSNTVWGLFWAVGIIHLWIRPVPRSMVLCGLPVLVIFMSLYAVYKIKGADTLDFLSTSNSYAEVENGTETTSEVLIGDLGRSDVQAFLLYRLFGSEVPYDFALGQTYVGALAMIVPREVWPSRPATKVKWTTEAEYGVGSFDNSLLVSSRVYGLIGETILNFGPLFVPLAFAVLAIVVARLRRAMLAMATGDSRLLVMPFLVNFCILLLINDSDNQVFFLFKYGLIPCLLVLFASRRATRVPAMCTDSYAYQAG
jgi:hypothetical protein